MQITYIQFRDFDRPATQTFIDKTPEEIHVTLSALCFTYEITEVIHATNGANQPLSFINQFNKTKIQNP